MGLYDRDYTQENYRRQFHNVPQMRMTWPSITPMVKRLLIINIAVYLLSIVIRPLGIVIYHWCQLDPSRGLQLWRLLTYQFLHDPSSVWHIFLNMLGLFFLGPTLERHWSGKKFLIFYLSCGAAGGLFYLLLVGVGFLPPVSMIGASGAILGMLAACAILFPHFIVFILFFPVPIRLAAVGLTCVYIVTLLVRGANAGGDAAHLAGMAAGAGYVFSQSWRTKLISRLSRQRSSRWEKKMAEQQMLQAEVDRILEKVHDSGISSLTAKEKRILKQATKAEQMKDKL